MVIQYLDTDNRLVVDTLYDGKNCITSRERNGVLSFSGKQADRKYTIEKKSGDLFYFAVFLSPYGRVDVSSEFYVNGDAMIRSTECSTSIAGTRNPSISLITGWTI